MIVIQIHVHIYTIDAHERIYSNAICMETFALGTCVYYFLHQTYRFYVSNIQPDPNIASWWHSHGGYSSSNNTFVTKDIVNPDKGFVLEKNSIQILWAYGLTNIVW